MSDSKNYYNKKSTNTSSHVVRAERSYNRNLERMESRSKNRDKFLSKNDKRLDSLRNLDEEVLRKNRASRDKRIEDRRRFIEEKIIKDDEVKKARFTQMTERTDERLSSVRHRRDERTEKHRKRVDEKRQIYDERVRKYESDQRIILENRLKRAENDDKNLFGKRKAVTISVGFICLIAIFVLMQNVLPSSGLKRKGLIENNNEIATVSDASIKVVDNLKPEKTYSEADEISEQQRLWDLLMEHYDGNTNAVLGVMCNLRTESHFNAYNLEDYNNDFWGVDDLTYTDDVNSGVVSRQDFLESRAYDMSNGYYNDYYQWVNVDGGYGYAQYTAYIKKEELFQFAEQWFAPGGAGENYRFNIGDPDMQAHYVIYLLESDEFASLDAQLRSSGNVPDACYAWLKFYEVPFDPYCDNYYTLAFERASYAEEIEAECAN